MQKGSGLVGILIIVGIIAGIGAVVFTSVSPGQNPFMPTDKEKSAIDMAEQMKDVMEEKSGEMMPNDETTDWKTYRNEEYGFEFKYPKEYIVKPEINDYFRDITVTFPSGSEFSFKFSVTNSFEKFAYPYEDIKEFWYENGEWKFKREYSDSTINDILFGKTRDGSKIFKLCISDAGATKCNYIIPFELSRHVVSLTTTSGHSDITSFLNNISIVGL